MGRVGREPRRRRREWRTPAAPCRRSRPRAASMCWFPPPRGSGKSTLVAGLAAAGFRTARPTSWPPWTWRAGSSCPTPSRSPSSPGASPCSANKGPWILQLPHWRAPGGRGMAGAGRGGRRAPPDRADPVRPVSLLVPRSDADAEAPALFPRPTDTEAFFALAVNAVNLLPHGAAAPRPPSGALRRCSAGCFFPRRSRTSTTACRPRAGPGVGWRRLGRPRRREHGEMTPVGPEGAPSRVARRGLAAAPPGQAPPPWSWTATSPSTTTAGQLLIMLNPSAAVGLGALRREVDGPGRHGAGRAGGRRTAAMTPADIAEDVRHTVRKLVGAGAGGRRRHVGSCCRSVHRTRWEPWWSRRWRPPCCWTRGRPPTLQIRSERPGP